MPTLTLEQRLAALERLLNDMFASEPFATTGEPTNRQILNAIGGGLMGVNTRLVAIEGRLASIENKLNQ